ncbi:MAG: hypothetical protein NTZ68_04140 [Candidatus Dependentiae bacterium]|nr:hypothetical protein [Candidatus Dependentiae bacterium]
MILKKNFITLICCTAAIQSSMLGMLRRSAQATGVPRIAGAAGAAGVAGRTALTPAYVNPTRSYHPNEADLYHLHSQTLIDPANAGYLPETRLKTFPVTTQQLLLEAPFNQTKAKQILQDALDQQFKGGMVRYDNSPEARAVKNALEELDLQNKQLEESTNFDSSYVENSDQRIMNRQESMLNTLRKHGIITPKEHGALLEENRTRMNKWNQERTAREAKEETDKQKKATEDGPENKGPKRSFPIKTAVGIAAAGAATGIVSEKVEDYNNQVELNKKTELKKIADREPSNRLENMTEEALNLEYYKNKEHTPAYEVNRRNEIQAEKQRRLAEKQAEIDSARARRYAVNDAKFQLELTKHHAAMEAQRASERKAVVAEWANRG